MAMEQIKRILVVPNEDGIGPSSLVSHLVVELLRKCQAGEFEFRIEAHVLNEGAQAFNRRRYEAHIQEGHVQLLPTSTHFRLIKDDVTGNVLLDETVNYLERDYRRVTDCLLGGLIPQYDLVVEFGVPAAAWWAREVEKPCVSLFDHAWGKTLQMLYRDLAAAQKASSCSWMPPCYRRVVQEVRDDEGACSLIFGFPTIIMPHIFAEYWDGLGVDVDTLQDVLGNPPELQQAMEHLGEQGLMPTDGDTTILIQGGGTPAWKSLIGKLVDQATSPEGYEKLESRGINLLILAGGPDAMKIEGKRKEMEEMNETPRVALLGFISNHTLQGILPAIDLMVTRAGGGSVNDAVACRTPFVCVPELTMSQTQAILRECLNEGITWIAGSQETSGALANMPPAKLQSEMTSANTTFMNDPLEEVIRQARSVLPSQKDLVTEKMDRFTPRAEMVVAERIRDTLQ